jgi:hypothetical protein
MDDVSYIALRFVYLAIGSAVGSFLQVGALQTAKQKLVTIEDAVSRDAFRSSLNFRSAVVEVQSQTNLPTLTTQCQKSTGLYPRPLCPQLFYALHCKSQGALHSICPLVNQSISYIPFPFTFWKRRVAAGCGRETGRPAGSVCVTSRQHCGKMWASLTPVPMQVQPGCECLMLVAGWMYGSER